jgi:hypothetical protein
MKQPAKELPIIQKTYDLILWYVPHLNRLPRDHKFLLGNRLIEGLYELLEGLIQARYSTEKLARLESLNSLLDVKALRKSMATGSRFREFTGSRPASPTRQTLSR